MWNGTFNVDFLHGSKIKKRFEGSVFLRRELRYMVFGKNNYFYEKDFKNYRFRFKIYYYKT